MESKELANVKINQRRLFVERHRQVERHQVCDKQRLGLDDIQEGLETFENLSEKDVTGIANRIKRRKKADSTDLVKLNHAFLRSPAHITTFVKITGAINVLVKELSDQNADLQQLAAECLCNLALGDEICCEKIVTFGGTYLLAYLHNVADVVLNITCLWTIQNLIINGHKAFKILHSQQLIPQLVSLTENTFSEELQIESLKTLDIILLEEHAELSSEEKDQIMQSLVDNLSETSDSVVIKLIYTAVTEAGCQVDVTNAQKIISTVTQKLFTLIDDFEIEICYFIRILSNLIAIDSESMKFFIEYLIVRNLKMSSLFNNLCELDVEFIVKEMLWLLSNIIKSCFGAEYLHYDDLYNEMKLSKEYYFE